MLSLRTRIHAEIEQSHDLRSGITRTQASDTLSSSYYKSDRYLSGRVKDDVRPKLISTHSVSRVAETNRTLQ